MKNAPSPASAAAMWTEKRILKTQLKEAFLSLPEEETFKYFNLFKQTLSGTLGKNLLNLEFPLDAENPGGPRNSF